MKIKENEVYSYHSFILPFQCISDERRINRIFDNDSQYNIWERLDVGIESNSNRVIPFECIEKKKPYFDSWKFFNETGRNLVFDDMQSDGVKNYEVKQDVLKPNDPERLCYIIGTKDKEYILPIRRIALQFYNLDIGILLIQCCNEEYRSIEAVKEINEYGRRLGFPYWPSKGTDEKKCAESLKIAYRDGKVLTHDEFLGNFKENRNVSLAYISTVVRDLINQNGSGYTFHGKSVSGKKEIQMKTLLNDKMYVAAYVCDKQLCWKLFEDYKRNNDSFSLSVKRSLLELIRVDLPGQCSIQNEKELSLYLEDHFYMDAFCETAEKLMAVTDQAYIKLVPSHDYEERYYIGAYVPLVVIPIMQRNTIAGFQQQIMQLSCCAQKRISTSVITQIMDVQKQYVVFQNQFLVRSLTVQKEGSFVYEKLQDNLNVQEENKALESQVGKLFELANINQGDFFTKWALTMSLAAMVMTCFTYYYTAQNISVIPLDQFSGNFVLLATILVELLVFLAAFLIMFKKRK